LFQENYSIFFCLLNTLKLKKLATPVIPKVPWTSLDIWSSKGRTFTEPNHFLLDQKKLTQFKCRLDQMSSEVQGTFGMTGVASFFNFKVLRKQKNIE
jgi:hypothetical protein